MVGYRIRQIRMGYLIGLTALLLAGSGVRGLAAQSPGEEHALRITVNPADGRYEIAMAESRSYALRAGVGLSWMAAGFMPPIIPGMSWSARKFRDIWARRQTGK